MTLHDDAEHNNTFHVRDRAFSKVLLFSTLILIVILHHLVSPDNDPNQSFNIVPGSSARGAPKPTRRAEQFPGPARFARQPLERFADHWLRVSVHFYIVALIL